MKYKKFLALVCLFLLSSCLDVFSYDSTWVKRGDIIENWMLFERVNGKRVVITRDLDSINKMLGIAFHFEVREDHDRLDQFLKTGKTKVTKYNRDYDSVIQVLPFFELTNVMVSDLYIFEITAPATIEVEQTGRYEYVSYGSGQRRYYYNSVSLGHFLPFFTVIFPLAVMLIFGVISGIRRKSKRSTITYWCIGLCIFLFIFPAILPEGFILSSSAIWGYIVIWVIIYAIAIGVREAIKKLFNRTEKNSKEAVI